MRDFLPALVLALLAPSAPLFAVDGTWNVLGPDGGPVNDLAFQPRSSQVLYAAVTGGVYKSQDAGATWAWAGSGLDPRSVTPSVAVDPVRPNIVYASQGALYRSTNGGRSWEPRPIASAYCYQVAVHPRSSGTVFAATTSGIYRASDGGASWSRVSQGLPRKYGATLIAFDPFLENRLFAWIQQAGFDQTVGQLVRSNDGGTTWQRLSTGPQQSQRIQSLAVDPRQPRTLYAGTNRAVYKSVDGGGTWKPTALSTVGFVWSLKMHPGLGDVYAGTDSGLFRSHDGGATWVRYSQGLEGAAVVALAFSPSSAPTVYAAVVDYCERAGVFKSVDAGSSWSFSGRGISALLVESVAVDPTNPNVLWVIASQVAFRSADRGRTWARVSPGPAGGDGGAIQVAVDPLAGATVYLVLPDGTVRRTRDSGETWETAGHLPTPPVRCSGASLVIDPRTPTTLYTVPGGEGHGLGMAKSADGGATWIDVLGDPADMIFPGLVIAPSSPSTLYVEGGGGRGGQRVVRSLDGGATWARIQNGLPPDFSVGLAVDPIVSTTVYGLTANLDAPADQPGNGDINKTVDGGDTWTLMSDAFRGRDPGPMAISPSISGLLYVAVTFDDVYEVQDGRGTAEPLGASPIAELYTTIAVDPADPCRIYAGTSLNGLLAFTKSGAAGCE
jgi:photosystem II stability/assembly factor-like uncharacterized protein